MDRRQELDGLIRLFEDYTIRRCWPQGSGQSMALSVVPALILDLSDRKARAIRVTLSHDGRILAEPSKFQYVWASETMPNDVRSEVDYAFYRRGKSWALCTPDAVAVLVGEGKECKENMWDSSPDLFPDLFLGLVRWQIEPRDFDRLVFVVSRGERESRVNAALGVLPSMLPNCADLFHQVQVLSLPQVIDGFCFLRDVQAFPEEGEQMLLLHNNASSSAGPRDRLGQMTEQMRLQRGDRVRATLHKWRQGKFEARLLRSDEHLALSELRRIAVCSEALDHVPDGILWFHGEDELRNQAVANYAAWKPALSQGELEALQRDVVRIILHSVIRNQALQQELQTQQQDVLRLEADVQHLQGLLLRARRILQRLASEPSLGIGEKVWLHSESTSAQPQP